MFKDKELREILARDSVLALIQAVFGFYREKSDLEKQVDRLEREVDAIPNHKDLIEKVFSLQQEMSLIKQLLNIEEVEELPKGLRKESKTVYYNEQPTNQTGDK